MKKLWILLFLFYFLLPNVALQAQPSHSHNDLSDSSAQTTPPLHKALDLIEASNYSAALHFLDSLLQKNDTSTFSHLHFYRGICHSELQQNEAALEDFSQTIALDSSFLDAFFERAYIQFDMKMYKAAIQDYTQVIHLYSIQNNLIDTHKDSDSEEVTFYNSLPLYYYLRGEAHIYAQHRKEGCLDVQKALELGWDDGLNLYKQFCK